MNKPKNQGNVMTLVTLVTMVDTCFMIAITIAFFFLAYKVGKLEKAFIRMARYRDDDLNEIAGVDQKVRELEESVDKTKRNISMRLVILEHQLSKESGKKSKKDGHGK